MALGAVAYLRKPVRFTELIPLIRRILGRPVSATEAIATP